jgi:ABC-type phosphate/phosphonate transport system substrate-binding protein
VSDVIMGAVAYDPKVVTIWEGFRAWLRDEGLDFDFVLYSNYERQVDDLLEGRIYAAWNSPLAWVRARRAAGGGGLQPQALVMRDTDQDLTSVIITRADADLQEAADLRGRRIATGAVDSPQATLLPLSHLRGLGLEPGVDCDVQRFDVGVGLHGDHIGGERDAAQALIAETVDAACIIDGNALAFAHEGILPAGATRVLSQTRPFDHCNMTVTDAGPPEALERFGTLLRSMSYADPRVRPLLDLEGLKEWRAGRVTGYDALERAVDETGFYDDAGHVTARDYRP